MVRIVFLLMIVLAKLATVFKAGQLYSATKMKEAAEQEMSEQNIPREFIVEIMEGIDQKSQKSSMTLDDFGVLLLDAVRELSDNVTQFTFDDVIDKTMETASEARKLFASWMRKAADVVDDI